MSFALSCFLALFCTSRGTTGDRGNVHLKEQEAWLKSFVSISPLIAKPLSLWTREDFSPSIFKPVFQTNVLKRNSSAVYDECTADECHVHFCYFLIFLPQPCVKSLMIVGLVTVTKIQQPKCSLFHTGRGL